MTMKVAEAYNQIATNYDAAYGDRKSLAENRLVWSMVERHLTVERGGLRPLVNRQVLDLGCGTGALLDLAKDAGVDINASCYTGVDVSRGMLSQAIAKYPEHGWTLGDMQYLPTVQSRSVDAVVSIFGALNYCERPERVVSEIGRVLEPGGRFLVMAQGMRYRLGRQNYILAEQSVERRLFGPYSLVTLFDYNPLWRFGSLRVVGMSGAVDWLPTSLPQRIFDRYIGLESRTIGRWMPAVCYYLIVSGLKLGRRR